MICVDNTPHCNASYTQKHSSILCFLVFQCFHFFYFPRADWKTFANSARSSSQILNKFIAWITRVFTNDFVPFKIHMFASKTLKNVMIQHRLDDQSKISKQFFSSIEILEWLLINVVPISLSKFQEIRRSFKSNSLK